MNGVSRRWYPPLLHDHCPFQVQYTDRLLCVFLHLEHILCDAHVCMQSWNAKALVDVELDALTGWTWRLMQGWHGECGTWRLFRRRGEHTQNWSVSVCRCGDAVEGGVQWRAEKQSRDEAAENLSLLRKSTLSRSHRHRVHRNWAWETPNMFILLLNFRSRKVQFLYIRTRNQYEYGELRRTGIGEALFGGGGRK